VTPSTVSTIPLSHRLLPFLRWWPRVDRSIAKADALAGLIGAVVCRKVAFATPRAPPEYGLYCAMVLTVVAAPFGLLCTQSPAPQSVSLMVFAVLALCDADDPAPHQLALTLALMSGMIMLTLGLPIRVLVNFMSSSVVVGFTAALGAFISRASSEISSASRRHRRDSPTWCSGRSGAWATPGRGWFSWRQRRLRSARSRTACCRGSHRC
jgi:MFS superfamily sulfate permease-like transporter